MSHLGRLVFQARLLADRARHLVSVPLRCAPHYHTEGRDSPYASLRFAVGERDALICYGRPSVRGRKVLGGLVPEGELWRMGANEPTTLHLPFRATVGTIPVPRGVYSLYAIPGPEWTLIVNRSTRQSGRTRDERGKRGNLFPEQLILSARPVDATRTELVLAWEEFEVVIPITA